MAFQHIRIKNSNVPGRIPGADKIDVAELCVNLKDHKLYSKDADGNVFELGGGGAQVPGGDTPPGSGNEIGDLFFDTTLNQLLYWDGSAWVPISGDEVQNLDDLKDVIITDPEIGEILIWNGNEWVNGDASDAILNPDENPPSNPGTNDIWLDTSQCPPVLNIWSDCEDPGNPEWVPIGGGGGGAKPIEPTPDEITSVPPFQGGTGTELDPYILQPIGVKPAGGSGQTVELITIAADGAEAGSLVSFTDNSVGAGSRFAQPTGVVGVDGTWSGRLVYNDTPDTAVDQDYTGDIQIGTTYFRWVVSQQVELARPIDPTPDEITSTPNFQGGTGTELDPFLLQQITVAPAGSSGTSVELITIQAPDNDPGDTIVWEDLSTGAGTRFAQPVGVVGIGKTWQGRLVYTDTPDSTQDTSYQGDLKIGTTYFRWLVEQKLLDAEPPEVATITVTEQNPGTAPRFTDQKFDIAVAMNDQGVPISDKEIQATVSGTITTSGQFEAPLETLIVDGIGDPSLAYRNTNTNQILPNVDNPEASWDGGSSTYATTNFIGDVRIMSPENAGIDYGPNPNDIATFPEEANSTINIYFPATLGQIPSTWNFEVTTQRTEGGPFQSGPFTDQTVTSLPRVVDEYVYTVPVDAGQTWRLVSLRIYTQGTGTTAFPTRIFMDDQPILLQQSSLKFPNGTDMTFLDRWKLMLIQVSQEGVASGNRTKRKMFSWNHCNPLLALQLIL